jgi:nucleotidyltransferase substrate binding protein (TIGR01987 family)
LSYLASVDLEQLSQKIDARLIDGIKNGQAQKFEYTFELCWKCIKEFLKRTEGVDEASPKKIIKAFYLSDHVSEDDYLSLLAASDDRNRLSHVYDPMIFDEILSRLPQYAALIERVTRTIEPKLP